MRLSDYIYSSKSLLDRKAAEDNARVKFKSIDRALDILLFKWEEESLSDANVVKLITTMSDDVGMLLLRKLYR